jgi:hypothetical protein
MINICLRRHHADSFTESYHSRSTTRHSDPEAALSDVNVAGDLPVTLPVGLLVRDDWIVHRRLY